MKKIILIILLNLCVHPTLYAGDAEELGDTGRANFSSDELSWLNATTDSIEAPFLDEAKKILGDAVECQDSNEGKKCQVKYTMYYYGKANKNSNPNPSPYNFGIPVDLMALLTLIAPENAKTNFFKDIAFKVAASVFKKNITNDGNADINTPKIEKPTQQEIDDFVKAVLYRIFMNLPAKDADESNVQQKFTPIVNRLHNLLSSFWGTRHVDFTDAKGAFNTFYPTRNPVTDAEGSAFVKIRNDDEDQWLRNAVEKVYDDAQKQELETAMRSNMRNINIFNKLLRAAMIGLPANMAEKNELEEAPKNIFAKLKQVNTIPIYAAYIPTDYIEKRAEYVALKDADGNTQDNVKKNYDTLKKVINLAAKSLFDDQAAINKINTTFETKIKDLSEGKDFSLLKAALAPPSNLPPAETKPTTQGSEKLTEAEWNYLDAQKDKIKDAQKKANYTGMLGAIKDQTLNFVPSGNAKGSEYDFTIPASGLAISAFALADTAGFVGDPAAAEIGTIYTKIAKAVFGNLGLTAGNTQSGFTYPEIINADENYQKFESRLLDVLMGALKKIYSDSPGGDYADFKMTSNRLRTTIHRWFGSTKGTTELRELARFYKFVFNRSEDEYDFKDKLENAADPKDNEIKSPDPKDNSISSSMLTISATEAAFLDTNKAKITGPLNANISTLVANVPIILIGTEDGYRTPEKSTASTLFAVLDALTEFSSDAPESKSLAGKIFFASYNNNLNFKPSNTSFSGFTLNPENDEKEITRSLYRDLISGALKASFGTEPSYDEFKSVAIRMNNKFRNWLGLTAEDPSYTTLTQLYVNAFGEGTHKYNDIKTYYEKGAPTPPPSPLRALPKGVTGDVTVVDNTKALQAAMAQYEPGKGKDDNYTRENFLYPHLAKKILDKEPKTSAEKTDFLAEFMTETIDKSYAKYREDYPDDTQEYVYSYLINRSSKSNANDAAKQCVDTFANNPAMRKYLDKRHQYQAVTMATREEKSGEFVSRKHICGMVFSEVKGDQGSGD